MVFGSKFQPQTRPIHPRNPQEHPYPLLPHFSELQAPSAVVSSSRTMAFAAGVASKPRTADPDMSDILSWSKHRDTAAVTSTVRVWLLVRRGDAGARA